MAARKTRHPAKRPSHEPGAPLRRHPRTPQTCQASARLVYAYIRCRNAHAHRNTIESRFRTRSRRSHDSFRDNFGRKQTCFRTGAVYTRAFRVSRARLAVMILHCRAVKFIFSIPPDRITREITSRHERPRATSIISQGDTARCALD